jgi:hypothetical protein
MGIAAPREAHARLFVNNEYIGLYAIVESIDKRFLERVFGEDDGYLYEYDWSEPYGFEYRGDELETYAEFFAAQTHETDSMSARYGTIRDMAWAFSESSGGQFAAAAGAFLDLAQFMTYVAIENFFAERDGLVGEWGMNNFYLYRFENSTRHQFIPWDKDVAYREIEHNIWFNIDTNVIASRASREPPFRQAYLDALRRCAELALQPVTPAGQGQPMGWLEWQVLSASTQIRAAADADSTKPYSSETAAASARELQEFARLRPAFVLDAIGGR